MYLTTFVKNKFMKTIAFILTILSTTAFAQTKQESIAIKTPPIVYVKSVNTLTIDAAFELDKRAHQKAS